jgi:hypothetical protein
LSGHIHNIRTSSAGGGDGDVRHAVGSGGGDVGANDGLSTTTGLTVDNEGSVAGTNAPYLQLLCIKKD